MVKAEQENRRSITHDKSVGRGLFFAEGFTLVEVMVAASIMVVLCVGTLSVFSFAVRINAGNNLRSQALTVLQKEAEFYRGLKFVPDPTLSDDALNEGTYTRPQRTSEDGTVFNLSVVITNTSGINGGLSDNDATLKEIRIVATPVNPKLGWLADLKTNLTFLRVRSN